VSIELSEAYTCLFDIHKAYVFLPSITQLTHF